mmetsp:Transcript_74541/g.112309  ORF Transcript_74541/g.112309 Transcript_74541/m.112309 type:complete len:297 (+) Transcript_74541:20-910(+)|eukprot:CAMPEP_0117039362 /NCGR_PEP_ID=MMETSP0472-20121206/27637_1 /TAXON_ID=693140 ORGANISM="Tiarina fusus, Strain LIS" /NCGR_SAMPLE_ID=MMETSP0472 /ASSEMBLY_ACC=CAM_ASM_000603 /LENGTH=296 /DNA_ID=CAMNT_0004749845 /DNA_START=20 /DNA_END=910 /DNA_ORIENTATION=+
MLTAAAIVAVGAGGAAAGGAVAGGFVLYKQRKKQAKKSKQGKSIKKEQTKHEELQAKTIEELQVMKKGDKYVNYELGMRSEGKESEENLRAASSHGHTLATYELGNRFLSGEFEPQSEDMALDFFLCAADRGHVESMIAAGDIYYGKEQWKEAKKFFKKADDLGNEEAGKKLAISKLQTAEGDLQCQFARSLEELDMREAVIWYTKAADQDHPESAYRLGKIYLEGNETISPCEDKAMMLLLQASGSGHGPASLLLSQEYEKKGMYEEALQRIQLCGKTPEIKEKIAELKEKVEEV